MAGITAFGSSSASQGVEGLGFNSNHRRDSEIFPPSLSESQFPDLAFGQEKIEYVNVSSLLAGEISVDQFVRGGQTAYDTGSGFWIGRDGSTAKFSIGNSAGDKLTWDGTTLSVTGTITVIAGSIAGLTITATALTAVSGGNTTIVSSGATAFTAGPTGSPTFTVTQAGLLTTTSALIGGWNVVSGYIYNLQSGTPTAAPADGVVLASGNEAITIYEDTEARIVLGYISAGVYGIVGYATDGATKLFELSDGQNIIAGWTITSTTFANSTNIILDASNKAISLNSATYGTDGIQLQYNAGNPRAYIGDGANEYFQFDGTNISWNSPASSMSTAGKLTTTSATIGGWEVVSGYIYNLQSGTPTAIPNDGLVLASGNEGLIIYEDTEKRVEVGYLSAGVYGIKAYATNGTTVIFEASDTQQIMAGWTFTDTSLYNLASGTPTSSPNDGLVFTANATPAVIAYEDTAKRVELGYLSAGVFGLKGYATNGSTVIFEMSDTQQKIAGWFFTDTTLATDATAANANVLIDSGNSLFRLGPTSGDYITMDGANKRIRSSDYVSGAAGAGFTLEPDLLEVGNIAARGIIRTAVFQKSVISSVGGSFAVVDSDALATDMTAADASTLTIAGNTTFAVGDILRIKDGVNDEWLEVTNIGSAPTYTVTRDKAAAYAANSNPAWTKGATVVNYQQSGDGLIYMTASDANAPYLQVATHAGSPWSTLTTRLRLGNLNGYLGYAADIYGLGVGSSGAGEANITIEPTNGLRIRSGTTTIFQVDMSGGATLSGWTIDADEIKDTAGVVGLSSAVTGGDDIRIWAGDATPSSAEFRVYESGALVASSATISGAITATSGDIGGWVVVSGYIYNLQSGTPTSTPNDGLVLASGNEGIIVYEDTAKRVELGYLSAGVYGLKVYDGAGSGVLFEASDAGTTIANFTIAASSLASGTLNSSTITSVASGSDPSLSEWTYSGAFTVTDADTVAWAGGTLTLSTGQAFTITGSNTGNMAAKTYVYFDSAASTTAFQTTTTLATATGTNKILIAIAQNATDEALFYTFNKDEFNLDGANVRVNSLTAGEISSLSFSGKTAVFDTGTVGGWNMTATQLYGLASGTPSSSPTDGIVITSGATASLKIYEDADLRLQIGNLSAGVFGIKVWDGAGSGTLFEVSDTQAIIAGWTIAAGSLANGTNIVLDATNKAISINDSTFGNSGIQIQYNAGDPRMYIGDGADQFFEFDGTTGTANNTGLVFQDIFGDGSDGDVTISVNTTLTTDMYYNSLTVNNGVTLTTANYRVFVKGTLTNNGTISNKGNAGSVGEAGSHSTSTNRAGGAGGAAIAAGFFAASEDGKTGSSGTFNNDSNPSNGTAGDSIASLAMGVAGAAGGGSNIPGDSNFRSGGAAGSVTAPTNKIRSLAELIVFRDYTGTTVTKLNGSAGSGSGAGGCGGAYSGLPANDAGEGGGGGGSGSPGGTMLLSASKIVNTGTITCAGGAGGDGGAGGSADPGDSGDSGGNGGGGGAGGSGGVMLLIYKLFTDSGTTTVAGGAAGSGGAAGLKNTGGGSDGTAGDNASAGTTGVKIQIPV